MYKFSADELINMWKENKKFCKVSINLDDVYIKQKIEVALKEIRECISNGKINEGEWTKSVSEKCSLTPFEVYEIYENSPLWMEVGLKNSPVALNTDAIAELCYYPLFYYTALDLVRENTDVCQKACNGYNVNPSVKGDVSAWKREFTSSRVLCLDMDVDCSNEIFAAARIDKSILDMEVDGDDAALQKNFNNARQMYNVYELAKDGNLPSEHLNGILHTVKNGYFASALKEIIIEHNIERTKDCF